MTTGSRDRVTVDLRGAGSVVHARAIAQGLTMAAYVRRILSATAGGTAEPVHAHPAAAGEAGHRLVKITLRLPAAQASLLALRARSAEVSQGSYVATLLDGQPPPGAAPQRREAIAALAKSTDQLAVISSDLHLVLRLLRGGASERAEAYRARMQTLVDDIRAHLDVACRHLAELQAAAPARSRRSQLREGS